MNSAGNAWQVGRISGRRVRKATLRAVSFERIMFVLRDFEARILKTLFERGMVGSTRLGEKIKVRIKIIIAVINTHFCLAQVLVAAYTETWNEEPGIFDVPSFSY